VHDPYFQHPTGAEFFQHEFPHERADLSHWRKRLGEKLELLLAESLRVAYETGALRTQDLARVTVNTTVQQKNITFPTDAKLLHAAILGLARLAKNTGCGCASPICAKMESWYSSMSACHILDHEARQRPRERQHLTIGAHWDFMMSQGLV
jgi:hypothetical protein